MEVGMGTDILLLPSNALQSIATDSLVKSTCLFLQQHNLELKHDIALPPQRSGDQIIMEALVRCNPTMDEFRVLNNCRLYLQAYFLSDIVTGDGVAISEDAWRGIRFEVPFKLQS